MATFRDYPGVYQTVNAIRIHQIIGIQRAGWDLELVIVDNDPNGPHSNRLRQLVASISSAAKIAQTPGYSQFPQPLRIRYEPLESPVGTSPPRNKVFEIATGDAVLCVDDHIDFMPTALERFCRWVDANPDSRDLLQGPMMLDGLTSFHTHFDPPFRDGMQGIWGTDYERAAYNDQEWHDLSVQSKDPFDIHGQGLGVFGCLKGQWLGFNPFFREFGGEEIYIHTKYRKAGRRTLCLPFLKWPHRFDNPNKRMYPLSSVAKVRNYVLGHLENGEPLDRVYRHFVLRENETGGKSVDTGVTQAIWDAIVDDPERYPVLPLPSRKSVVKSKGCCGTKLVGGTELVLSEPVKMETPVTPPVRPINAGLEKRFAKMAADTPDQAGLMTRVRDIVGDVQTVIEYAPVASALSVAIAVHPAKSIYYWYEKASGLSTIIGNKTQSAYQPLPVKYVSRNDPQVEPIGADVGIVHGWTMGEPIEKGILQLAATCDRLLFLFKPNDPRAAEMVPVNNAEGKTTSVLPGVLPIVRKMVRANPEWSVIETRVTTEGYLYISRLAGDRKDIKPSLLQQAITFSKAKLDLLIKDGGKYLTEDQAQYRIDMCSLCESRSDNRCSECGCPLFSAGEAGSLPGKVYHASQFCPVGKWFPLTDIDKKK